jgi:NitT/TauT family transport system ATP-binding protein
VCARRRPPPLPRPSTIERPAGGPPKAVLAVKDLCKTFGAGTARSNRVLDHISFDVRGKTFVSIVGPSGSGKSTLLNIISGVEPHTSGDLQLTSDQGKPARLGYVFQDARLLPWRTVRQNMLYVQDRDDEEARRRVDKYLDMVGLGKHGDFFPGQLSGGMQQRVGIARAFAVEPDLLIMDEPFSHLDAITARELRAQLQDIWARTKKTVVFVTHDVVEAVELSDRIIVLQPGGRIFEEITVELPHPRRQSDPAVATLQAEVLARLENMKALTPQVAAAT